VAVSAAAVRAAALAAAEVLAADRDSVVAVVVLAAGDNLIFQISFTF
jgi:hypothetical protein